MPDLRAARLALARAIRIVLRNGLGLLGLNAPDRMDREEAAMSLLVVGSVALDTIETPFGVAERCNRRLGHVFQCGRIAVLSGEAGRRRGVGLSAGKAAISWYERGVDLAGLEQVQGESFRWSGVYSYDLNSRETRETRLGVFADFKPKIPAAFQSAEWVFLGNIDPVLQLDVLRQVKAPQARGVRHHELLDQRQAG